MMNAIRPTKTRFNVSNRCRTMTPTKNAKLLQGLWLRRAKPEPKLCLALVLRQPFR